AQRLLTPRPSRLRLVFDGGQLCLELGDAVADLAAIKLYGRLPRAPQPDAAALALTAAGLAQPGGHIGEPRDLDLQPCRSARRVPMEDLDDHTRAIQRSEEHTSELQSRVDLVCRLLLEKKKRT